MAGDQAALTEFEGAAASSAGDSASAGSTSKSDSSPSSTTTSSRDTPTSSLLDDLYDDVRTAARGIPDSLLAHDITVPLEPPSGGFVTNGIPDSIPALPASVGNWSLAGTDDEYIVYGTDGQAYDARWGRGGMLHRVRVKLNDSGANSDGLYHQSSETVTGFGNPSQVRNADLGTESALTNVPGQSVKNNDGDYSVLHGTEQKSETLYDAVVNLVVHLHLTPTPLGNYVPQSPDTAWELTRLSTRTARWKTPAPDSLPKEHLSVSLSASDVKVSAYDDSDSLPDRIYAPVPVSSECESMIEQLDDRTSIPALSAGCAVVREFLSKPPVDAVHGTSLPTNADTAQ